MKLIVVALLLLVSSAAFGQPCAGYHEQSLGARFEELVARHQKAAQVAHDPGGSPNTRIGGFVELARVAADIRPGLGLCGKPEAREDDRFRRATGYALSEAERLRHDAYADCGAYVAHAHVAGAGARECLDAVMTFRRAIFLVREPPAAWSSADADGSAALFEQTARALAARPADRELRMTLASMQLASNDFEGALGTVAALGHGYDAELIRGAALYGLERSGEAERLFGRLIRRAPERREAHFDLALLISSLRFDSTFATRRRLRTAFDHARVALCLTHPQTEHELADDATDLARVLQEHLTGESAWAWRSPHEQPRLFVPWARLGPSAQSLFDRNAPHTERCATILSRAR